MKKRVLFVCVHNSARSQIAEAFLNQLGKGEFTAQSAGLEPGKLNPLVVAVMKEIGIDISQNKTKSVVGFLQEKQAFDYVITVCDAASSERCPTFPGNSGKLHWGFEDPSLLQGTEDAKLKKIRLIRDQIKSKIQGWLSTF